MSNLLGNIKGVVKKEGFNLNRFKETLKGLCDEYYNGNNGEIYYITIKDANGDSFKISNFDYLWGKLIVDINFNNFDFSKLVNISKNILMDNYSNRKNYADSSIDVYETKESIVMVVSYKTI